MKGRKSDEATPLFMAARNGHLEVVKALLEAHGVTNCVELNWWETHKIASKRGGGDVDQLSEADRVGVRHRGRYIWAKEL